ncbi:hypothetical protein QCA50_000878 [Cerrena zonata]|uniref:Uncharacterized protein n=1 Tax=Cerrena zonata TaxID=2478898 RepID=A0AAW0GSK5_9APHY
MAALSSQAPFSTFQPNSLSSQTPAELRNFLVDLINNIDKTDSTVPMTSCDGIIGEKSSETSVKLS